MDFSLHGGGLDAGQAAFVWPGPCFAVGVWPWECELGLFVLSEAQNEKNALVLWSLRRGRVAGRKAWEPASEEQAKIEALGLLLLPGTYRRGAHVIRTTVPRLEG